ncbi:MAG: nucleotidyltransferase family protein [Candidatus Omnitrophota bacterium]|jgi:glucose-1-phosphate thymidylyltransferase
MKALILAAGYATRLYPITKDYPKPLLEVGKKPIIDHILDKFERLDGVDEILVVTNSKFMPHFRQWKKGLKTKKKITLINDLTKSHGDRRGAIGDMNFVIRKKRLRDDLLVVGGDNIFSGNLKRFFSFARRCKGPVIGAYNIKDKREARKYGVIRLDKGKRVVDFKEKPKDPGSSLIAMCIYYFPEDKLSLIKEYLRNRASDKHDATGFYIDWLRRRTAVYGFVFEGVWYDIGDHKFYRKAQEDF